MSRITLNVSSQIYTQSTEYHNSIGPFVAIVMTDFFLRLRNSVSTNIKKKHCVIFSMQFSFSFIWNSWNLKWDIELNPSISVDKIQFNKCIQYEIVFFFFFFVFGWVWFGLFILKFLNRNINIISLKVY